MVPLATSTRSSINFSPAECRLSSPEMMVPALKSMISGILWDKVVLEETLITGLMGFPVGVPNPVVNKIRLAPLHANAVVLSTSLPGVQRRLRPDFLMYSG